MIGETLGGYRITHKLGEGGMGVVYVAEHALIGRKAAIKVLLPELSKNAEIVNRFFNEAKATATIRHPGLVDVFDFGYHPTSGSAYLAMELLDGESLSARLRRDLRLPVPVTVAVGQQIAAALGAAHDKGIVHRDLKPDNLFLVPDRLVAAGVRVKVLDFGIAKLAAGEGSDPGVRTRTGAVMGTPLYMSPEQCKGAGHLDHRTDIYALGCILYECVAGRPPFTGEGFGEIIGKHMYEAPPPLVSLAGALPPALEHAIMRALAKNPAERFASMHEVEAALAAVPVGAQVVVPSGVESHPPRLPPHTPTPLDATRAPGGTPVGGAGGTPVGGAGGTPVGGAGGTPTTLSSAAGESGFAAGASTGAGRFTRRRWLWGGAAGAVIATAAVTLFVLQGNGGSASAPAASAASGPRLEDRPGPGPGADPLVAAPAPADAAPAPAPPPAATPADAAPPPAPTRPDAAPHGPAPRPDPALPATLGKDVITATLDGAYQAVVQCGRKHDFVGGLDVRFDVSGAGKVSNVSLTDGNMGSAFGNCVEGVIGRLKFPRWQGPSTTVRRHLVVTPEPTTGPLKRPDPGLVDPDADDQEAVRLEREARQAYLNGQYGQALELAQKGLELAPKHQNLLATAVMSACKLKDAGRAKRFAARLAGPRRQAVAQVCVASGVELEP